MEAWTKVTHRARSKLAPLSQLLLRSYGTANNVSRQNEMNSRIVTDKFARSRSDCCVIIIEFSVFICHTKKCTASDRSRIVTLWDVFVITIVEQVEKLIYGAHTTFAHKVTAVLACFGPDKSSKSAIFIMRCAWEELRHLHGICLRKNWICIDTHCIITIPWQHFQHLNGDTFWKRFAQMRRFILPQAGECLAHCFAHSSFTCSEFNVNLI